MPQPFLHFAQVGAPIQGVGGGRGAQGVRAEAFSINSRRLSVFPQHAVVNGPVGERPVGLSLPRRVFERPEERAVNVLAVAGGLQVGMDALQGGWPLSSGAAGMLLATKTGHLPGRRLVRGTTKVSFLRHRPASVCKISDLMKGPLPGFAPPSRVA